MKPDIVDKLLMWPAAPNGEDTLDARFICQMLASAATALQSAQAEITRLRKRLETPDAPFDTDACDGIACRDATIKGQDERIAWQAAEIERLREAVACAEYLIQQQESVIDGRYVRDLAEAQGAFLAACTALETRNG